MEKDHKILVINPGSTSTKVAVFLGEVCLFSQTIRHFIDELMFYPTVISQYEFRKDVILGTLEIENVDITDVSIVIGRGGLTYPLKSGIYEVDDRMLVHVRKGVLGQHASNLGPLLAYEIARDLNNAKAYIADPVVTDEMEAIARISGHPKFERRSIFHALNQKAVARLFAKSANIKYSDLNLIVAHMGGGVSVGAHQKGQVVDVNNALDGEGPYSPERSGTLPVGQLIKLCFSDQYSKEEIEKMVVGEGGFTAYLQTNNMQELIEKAESNEDVKLLIDAFVYQVAKSIGEMATVLKGDVDAIILTGGIAYSDYIVKSISNRVEFIAPIEVYAGEDEMAAMALNANLLLKGELTSLKYPH